MAHTAQEKALEDAEETAELEDGVTAQLESEQDNHKFANAQGLSAQIDAVARSRIDASEGTWDREWTQVFNLRSSTRTASATGDGAGVGAVREELSTQVKNLCPQMIICIFLETSESGQLQAKVEG